MSNAKGKVCTVSSSEFVTDVVNVTDGVDEIAKGVQKVAISQPTSTIPAVPANFFGRDDEVKDIAERLVTDDAPIYLGILGDGGIGKTSLALAVAAHVDVVQHFGVERRHWARCVEATSPGLLIEIIARSLGLEKVSKDRFQSVINFLEQDDQPRLLFLDNFETAWDVEDRQSEVEDVLEKLAAVPNLAIVVTMRGELPESERFEWSQPELEPLAALPEDAASLLYTKIHTEAAKDRESVDEIVAELDHSPLAITIVAKVGRLCEESPSDLLERWKERDTSLEDEADSVDSAIEFAIGSKYLEEHPDSLKILSVVAALPGGAPAAWLLGLIPSVENTSDARDALFRSSLLYPTPDMKLHVLPPVREYIENHLPLEPELWEAIPAFYKDFVEANLDRPGTAEYVSSRAIILDEQINLESVYTRSLQEDKTRASVLAALRLCEMATYTSPDVLMVAAELARELENGRNLLAQVLEALGYFEYARCRYEDSLTYLDEAVTEHEAVGKHSGAAKSLLCIADIYRVQGKEAEAQKAIGRARDVFEQEGDRLQIARCTWRLAEIDFAHCKWDKARPAYERAREEFNELPGGKGEAAVCLQCIGDIDMMEENYDKARPILEEARKELLELGAAMEAAACLRSLGTLNLKQDKCAEAREVFEQAFDEYRTLEHPSGIARSLVGMGEACLRLPGRGEEGLYEVMEAKKMFVGLGISSMVSWCDKMLNAVQRAPAD
ncbi:hypothetical protein FRB93_003866 [Tulasnella sp. JGI-2019a]|nr:hypothetical protein FRB93_003866 [Tulasnella sp. JGI-2019a]